MDPNWFTGIGTLVLALATVVLAGVTVWSVRKNNEANKLLREENERLHRQEHERLGKLQAIDFVSSWADEVNSIIGGKMFSLQSEGPLNEFLHRTASIRTDIEAIKKATQLFDDNFQATIIDGIEKFNKFVKTIFALRDSYMNNPGKDTSELQEKLKAARITTLNSFIKLQVYVRKNRISFLI